MATSIARFEAYNEGDDIEEHFEWVELFFEVHKIATAKNVVHPLRYWPENLHSSQEHNHTNLAGRM